MLQADLTKIAATATDITKSAAADLTKSTAAATDITKSVATENVNDTKDTNPIRNCIKIYNNLGGVRGQFNNISPQRAANIENAIDNVSNQIIEYLRQFLHVVFGGKCHPIFNQVDQVRYNKCLQRRFFWPYKIYNSIILNENDEDDDEDDDDDDEDENYGISKAIKDNTTEDGHIIVPKLAVLIIDNSISEDLDIIPDLTYLDFDNIANNQKWKDSVKVWQLNNWVFPTNKVCIFYKKIINLFEIVKNNGGIISILNEIKSYNNPSNPIINFMIPFISYAVENKDKVLFVSWQLKT